MKYKNRFSFGLAAALALCSAGAWADQSDGRSVGNGGGAWVCRVSGTVIDLTTGAAVRYNDRISWIQMVDLFEAESEFRLTLEPYTGSVEEIVDRVMAKLFRADRALFEAISPRVERLGALEEHPPQVVRTRDNLTAVNEGPYRVYPENRGRCRHGTIAREPEQVVNYKHDGGVLVQERLFTSLASNAERAAMVIHEAVYAYRRTEFHDRNSSNARRVTGLLMSNLSIEELSRSLAQINPLPVLPDAPAALLSLPTGHFRADLPGPCDLQLARSGLDLRLRRGPLVTDGSNCILEQGWHSISYCGANWCAVEDFLNGPGTTTEEYILTPIDTNAFFLRLRQWSLGRYAGEVTMRYLRVN